MSLNKKALREDFFRCCAYCGDSDFDEGEDRFHVDHFAPKSLFPDYEYNYENLIYACSYCNRSKSNKWPGRTVNDNVVGCIGFEKPTSLAYDSHFERKDNGSIVPLDKLGSYMHDALNLGLIRHACLYRMGLARQKIDEIDKEIVKVDNPDIAQKLMKLRGELAYCFFEYYRLMRED